jgi:hypothetical protein
MMELVLTPYVDIVDPTTNDDGEKIQFTFAELEPAAQKHALDKEGRELDYEWWDCTYEDVIASGELLGVVIGSNKTICGGRPINPPDISFSGFCSQGDGCCFSGELHIDSMANAIESMAAFTSQQELVDFAVRAQEIHGLIVADHISRRLIANEDDHNHYWIEPDSVVDIKGDSFRGYRTRVDDPGYENIEKFEEMLNDFVSDYANYIHDQLENQYDHLTSDESAIERFTNDDVLFDEFGSKI